MIAAVSGRSPAVLCVGACLCAFAIGLRAGPQPQAGSISGRVVDRNGAMPFAEVRVRPANDAARALEATADGDGVFAFPNLPAGEYELQVAMPGSETTTDRRVNVSAAQNAAVTIEGFKGCDTFANERGSTTAADLREVIVLAIHEALNDQVPILDDVRVFSTANVPRGVDLAKILPRGWEVLTPERISTRADLRDGVSYLTISTIRARGGCIAVEIEEGTARRKSAPVVVLGGWEVMNEYRRTAAGWQEKRVYHWER